MKISIASDHRGFRFKEIIKQELEKRDIEIIDAGTYNEESCDYPDFAQKALRYFLKKEVDFVILICGSGIGMSITANKYKGIRAALCLYPGMAKMAREDNDANVLVFSANFTQEKEIPAILDNWLKSNFQGGRHERRVNKIRKIEEDNFVSGN